MDAILPSIAEFEREGFRLIAYQKTTQMLWPDLVDNCGATLIHSSGEFFALVVHQELRGGKTALIRAVSIFTTSGVSVGVIDSLAFFDPLPTHRTIALPGVTIKRLWARICVEYEALKTCGEEMTCCQTAAQYGQFSDAHQAVLWHHRINVRRIYRKLNDAEVKALEDRMRDRNQSSAFEGNGVGGE
jgi:hypothetical protein